MIRFPKVCLRCGALGHYSEECTRMPDGTVVASCNQNCNQGRNCKCDVPGLGMSSYERAMVAAVRRDRATILWAAVAMAVALLITGWLQ